ncbi:MAG TPA: NAD(P)H-binding protein [Gammaproteobacteria bacterium]|jgi:hypothetical protein
MRTQAFKLAHRLLQALVLTATLSVLALSPLRAQSGGDAAGVEPLRIAVFGASGRVGSRIVTEALSRGHFVTGVGRDVERLTESHPHFSKVEGDVTDSASVATIVPGHDAVVSAIGGSNPDSDDPTDSIPVQAATALITALRDLGPSAPRIIFVGGGSTTLQSSPGVYLDDPTDVPEGARAARIFGHRVVLETLSGISDLRWTFFSPALQMRPGERTGVFRVGGSLVLRDANGESAISMEDFAVATIDELEHPRHIGRQTTVAY